MENRIITRSTTWGLRITRNSRTSNTKPTPMRLYSLPTYESACVRIFAYCVHAKSAGISIKTSHEHLLLHCPAVPLKVAKFQVAKNKRIDRRFIYISDSLLSLTLPASDFHPSHRRGKCLACISLLFADSSARVLAPQAGENHCKFSINFKTMVSCCKENIQVAEQNRTLRSPCGTCPWQGCNALVERH